MRLLAEVLCDKLTRVVQSAKAVFIERTNDQLRPIDLFNAAPCAFGSCTQVFHRFAVVGGRDEIVEQHSVGDLAR